MPTAKDRQVVLHPLLFGVYQVFFLYHANSEVFDFSVVLTPLVVSLTLTLVLWWGINRITRDKKRSAIYTSVLVLGGYSFGPIQDLLGKFSFEQGFGSASLGVRFVATSFVIVLVSAILGLKLAKHVGAATYVVNIVALALVCVPLGETAVMTIQRLQLHQFVPDRSAFEAIPPAIAEAAAAPGHLLHCS